MPGTQCSLHMNTQPGGGGQEGAKATDHSWVAEPWEMASYPADPPPPQVPSHVPGKGVWTWSSPASRLPSLGLGSPSVAEHLPLVSAYHPPGLCHQKLSIDPSLK